MSFQITEILVNQERTPIGMDIALPTISWKLTADMNEVEQKNYRVVVCKQKDGETVWDTGVQESKNSTGVKYSGNELEPCTRYNVIVEIWEMSGEKKKESTFFETGLMSPTIEAWNGAKWIGAPEFYVTSDVMSVFSIESKIKSLKNGTRAGIVFGANDPRLSKKTRNEMLLEGTNYIGYVLDVSSIPAKIDIFRVGYDKNDQENIPFASFYAISDTTKEPVITQENRYDPHTLTIEVMGNAAFAYIDQIRVDSVKRKTFSGEKTAPRQLNPLGFNDVTTYPRLCDIGYYVDKHTEAYFDGLTIKNIRTPKSIIAQYDIEKGKTIRADETKKIEVFNPSRHSLPMLRCDFQVDSEVESARLYATARGIYTVHINGEKVTDQYFMPGASQYDKHLMYQTFDITDHLNSGTNGIGFTLAPGWWSDMSTYALYNYNYWGDKPSLLAKIEITYRNGTRKTITSDCDNWQYYGEGPFQYSSFFNGEKFDERKGWIYKEFSMPEFHLTGMKKPQEITPVTIMADKPSSPLIPGWEHVNLTQPQIVGSFNAPVKAVEYFHPKTMKEPVPGLYIYDLGQEIAGIVSIRFHGEEGTKIRIRYGEMLYPEQYGELSGMLLQANLREASNTDEYILSGTEDDVFCPEFTFHGFRYIEISGVKTPPELNEVTGILLSSVSTVVGNFECSNPLVNRLVKNVKYSMLSNYISIPTDCPQRNERMGWCGDTHVFTRTATYFGNVKNFLLRNMQAMKDLQRENGHLPDIAPIGGGFGGITYESALIIMTWELYQQYGDIDIVKENYQAMDCWMQTMEKEGMPGKQYKGFLGDWLAIDETDNYLVWNAFYGRNAKYMQVFSEYLGKKSKANHYKQKYEETKVYWRDTFLDNKTGITRKMDGTICDTQGSYVIGLDCGMFENEEKSIAIKHLVRKIKEAGYTVRTGFFGTGPLNRVLTENNQHEAACQLFTQTSYPSWLYPVTQGATTVWERWDSFTRENGFGKNNAMNSFDHYSLGSVLSWCYESILGIQRDEKEPGYSHCYLKPQVYGFKYARGKINTPFGELASGWEIDNDMLNYSCQIPVNMRVDLELNGNHYELTSGKYNFCISIREES